MSGSIVRVELAEEEEADTSLRAYRFGKLDVLNPEHCDFTPLRQVILANAKASFPLRYAPRNSRRGLNDTLYHS